MPVPIGKLRDRVAILTPTSTLDAAGGEVREFSATGHAQCWIKALRGREFLEARQVVNEVTHRIVGHYSELKDVDADYRIREVATGREFDVQVPIPSDRRDQVELLAVLRPSDG